MRIKLSSPRRLRTRLALSYIVLLIGATIVFSAATAVVIFLQMRSQLSHFAVQDIETMEGLISFTPDGSLTVRDDYHNHAESKLILDHYLEVLSTDGAVLYRNDRLGNLSLGGRPLPHEGIGGYSERSSRLPDGTRVVMASRRHSLQGRSILIRLGYSEEPVWRAVEQFLTAAALLFPFMIAAAAIASYRMSRSILVPVQNIASLAGEITSSRLNERIPVTGAGDEVDHLAEAFNGTLARLDQSFKQLRQFTSDASHELRTPLAALRSIGEVGLDRDGSREDYRELVGSMLEEVNRLTRLVDDLLMIARGDSGAIPLHYAKLDVFALLRETIALLEPLAEEKRQQLVLSGEQGIAIQADSVFLRQALINVIHNAIKYSPASSTTSVVLENHGARSIAISVVDEGPGIADEHIARIFDRFYRVDSGRSREAGGFGLGLAIAQWAVQAHGGTIAVTATPSGGSLFSIQLPKQRDIAIEPLL